MESDLTNFVLNKLDTFMQLLKKLFVSHDILTSFINNKHDRKFIINYK